MQPAVLLVEDEDAVRAVLTIVLREHGYIVYEAENYLSALDLWNRSPLIDILLVDYLLGPGPTGAALAARLRNERPDLRILMISGLYEHCIEEDLPGIDFLMKPFTMKELLRVLAPKPAIAA